MAEEDAGIMSQEPKVNISLKQVSISQVTTSGRSQYISGYEWQSQAKLVLLEEDTHIDCGSISMTKARLHYLAFQN